MYVVWYDNCTINYLRLAFQTIGNCYTPTPLCLIASFIYLIHLSRRVLDGSSCLAF